MLECFQFKKDEDVDIEELKDELADVLWWVLLMSEDLNIDIKQALEEKLQKTEKKYPVEKAKGSSLKYTKF